MKKFLVYVFLIFVAIILAGIYGAIHDQISYTISSEYFTKFKFHQFGLDGMPLPNRVQASIVGFLASWWMGIPISILIGACGFIHSSWRQMLKISLWSFFIAIIFTFLFGLCGLFYGWLKTRVITLADYQGWFIPDDIIDLRRFLCAGYMHNFSYLGGTFAIFVATAFHIAVKIKNRNQIV